MKPLPKQNHQQQGAHSPTQHINPPFATAFRLRFHSYRYLAHHSITLRYPHRIPYDTALQHSTVHYFSNSVTFHFHRTIVYHDHGIGNILRSCFHVASFDTVMQRHIYFTNTSAPCGNRYRYYCHAASPSTPSHIPKQRQNKDKLYLQTPYAHEQKL